MGPWGPWGPWPIHQTPRRGLRHAWQDVKPESSAENPWSMATWPTRLGELGELGDILTGESPFQT